MAVLVRLVLPMLLAWPMVVRGDLGEAAVHPHELRIPSVEDPAMLEARRLVLRRDFEGAIRSWKSAAKQGSSRACYRLGAAYRSGRGVKQDDGKAVYWLEKAAAGGDADAQYALGVLYRKGQGVHSNRSRAIELFGDASILLFFSLRDYVFDFFGADADAGDLVGIPADRRVRRCTSRADRR